MTDQELMGLALEEAKKAAALGEVPVGAVVAKDGEPVAMAHNTRETEKNALHHAELLAIDAACKKLGGWRLWQCELFVTLEPCPMCSGAIINSRIKRVVYGAKDTKAGCCGSLVDLFSYPFNHHPVIESGSGSRRRRSCCRSFLPCCGANGRRKRGNERKTVLVTGASRGIGAAAMARAFAAAGYRVAANYNTSKAEAEALAAQWPGRVLPVQADVANRAQVETMFRQVEETFGGVDVLVCNAGIARQELFTDVTPERGSGCWTCT